VLLRLQDIILVLFQSTLLLMEAEPVPDSELDAPSVTAGNWLNYHAKMMLPADTTNPCLSMNGQ
jgi:hypothetical protein